MLDQPCADQYSVVTHPHGRLLPPGDWKSNGDQGSLGSSSTVPTSKRRPPISSPAKRHSLRFSILAKEERRSSAHTGRRSREILGISGRLSS